MKVGHARYAILAWAVFLLVLGQAAAKDPAQVQIELFSGRSTDLVAVRDEPDLAPVLHRCLFENGETRKAKLSPRTFALECVVPYIHGLWLDPTVLYRSNSNIIEQATDKLVEHPSGEPFPVFYPPRLQGLVTGELNGTLKGKSGVVLKPLPDPLPEPCLDPSNLYNNVGFLYLPNPYVVPGDSFNEMYGWDS